MFGVIYILSFENIINMDNIFITNNETIYIHNY